MKYVILHADGCSDSARPERDGHTPVESAITPNLDRLAQSGERGSLTVPKEGILAGSEATGMAVLGYDPRKLYPGPAPLEAASLGVSVGEHDVVFCCTMVTLGGDLSQPERTRDLDIKKLNPHLVMDDATAGCIGTEEARELIDVMNEQLGSESIQFYPGAGHRHLMVWVGGKARTACSDPQHVMGKPVGEYLPQGDGADTLRKLMEASIVILRDHPVNVERRAEGLKPANCLWLWGQGRATEWPAISERYPVTGAVITASDVHRGVGLYAGLTPADLPVGETDNGEVSYASYAKAAARELERHDVLYIHARLDDGVRHGSDVKENVQSLQDFDRDLVGPLLDALEKHQAYRLLVVCDPVYHSAEQPASAVYAFCEGPLRGRSPGIGFSEAGARATAAGPRDATKLLHKLLRDASVT